MITRVRNQSKKILQPIAKALIKMGLTANTVTLLGLVLSFVYLLIMYIFKNPLLGVLLIAISAFMDALDGEIARLAN
ncbi:MAG: CDP-alcohol phosphatidyltransferase family protein, partial [Sulfolobaceae archaeon]